ncbi:Creatinine amidohydrolase, partial [Dysosmobacter welbionis]
AELFQMYPAVVHHSAEGVRQQHLFDGATTDGVDTRRGVGPVRMEESLFPQLGEKDSGPQNGAGGNGGEKQPVEQKGIPRRGDIFPGIDLLQQPQLLEGKKAQPQRSPAHLHRAAGEELRILESHQYGDVIDAGKNHCPAAAAGPGHPADSACCHADARQQAGNAPQHHRPSSGAQKVEYRGGRRQHRRTRSGAAPPRCQAHRQRCGQKAEKGQRLKAHLVFSVRPLRRASAVLSTWVRLWHRPGYAAVRASLDRSGNAAFFAARDRRLRVYWISESFMSASAVPMVQAAGSREKYASLAPAVRYRWRYSWYTAL